jgi:hypothetical protein
MMPHVIEDSTCSDCCGDDVNSLVEMNRVFMR